MQRIEHFIEANDGIKSFVLEIVPKNETKPPIFCIHGLTRNHKDFNFIFDFLSNLGHRIYAVDVRGRGLSDYDQNPINYNPFIYVLDVINIFEKLELQPCIFLGTSMGGIMSMILASMRPDLVKAIILNDVGPEVNVEGINRLGSYVGRNYIFQSFKDIRDINKAIHNKAYPLCENDEAFWDIFTKNMTKQIDGGFIFDYDPKIKENIKPIGEGVPAPNLWAQFEMLKMPIMVIHGEYSDILTNDIIDKMKAINSDLLVCEVKQTGHAPTLSENIVKDNIALFLKDIK